MEKKIIFLELPTDVIEKIDEQNQMDSRSIFVSELLEKQLQTQVSEMHVSSETPTTMQVGELEEKPGEVKLVDNKGMSLGTFDVNTEEGFEQLAKKIDELSDDPVVRMKARRWR